VSRQRIGRYEVTGTLGQGGMGVVYAARDPHLGRALAIKTLHATSADPIARERLTREARTAAALNHPSICQLYEIGEDEGELFLAMELLEGESLATRMARGPFTVSEAVSIGLGIQAGIDALHRHGIVHRDLKPSNVFLTNHGVKLLDFGVAMVSASDVAATATRLTTPGMVVGTPQYCAPETLRGEPADARTDIFAAGIIVYEMLSGQTPYPGRTAIEVFHSIMYDDPPVLTGGPAITALDRVIHKAVAKRREDRYQTAEAFAQELRAALLLADTQPVAARTVTRLIVLPLRILRPDAETDFLAFSLADAVTSSLSTLQPLVVRSSVIAGRFASGTPDLKALAAEADVDVAVMGTMIRAGDQVRVTTQLVETPSGTVIASHTAQAPVLDLFALQDELTTRIVEALSLPLTARERRMLRHDVPSTPHAYERYLRANELSRDTRHWKAARNLYLDCLGEDPHYAPAWGALGRMHRLIAKYLVGEDSSTLNLAEAAFKRALELNPDLSSAENAYAHLEVDLGRATDAMARLLRLAKTRSSDPDLFAGLVHACRYCGLLRASVAAFEQARRLDPRIPSSVAVTFFMLGEYERVLEFAVEGIPYIRNAALVMLGKPEEALESLSTIDDRIASLMISFTSSLRLLLTGKPVESVEAMRLLREIRDPEARYFVGRHFAHAGDHEGALHALEWAVDNGFLCAPAMARDPWLDPIRGLPEFSAIVRRAEARHRDAVVAFLSAEGDRLLGLGQPA
jgi:serine/threonine protein kinase/tetratricopeptide (TPR) repeat protein